MGKRTDRRREEEGILIRKDKERGSKVMTWHSPVRAGKKKNKQIRNRSGYFDPLPDYGKGREG